MSADDIPDLLPSLPTSAEGVCLLCISIYCRSIKLKLFGMLQKKKVITAMSGSCGNNQPTRTLVIEKNRQTYFDEYIYQDNNRIAN